MDKHTLPFVEDLPCSHYGTIGAFQIPFNSAFCDKCLDALFDDECEMTANVLVLSLGDPDKMFD